MRKAPPVYESELVFHPERDTTYLRFENAAANPFVPNPPAGVPRVNVWWLADAALTSYSDPPAAKAAFAAGGLTAEFVSGGDTDVYVASNSDTVIVAFRGTEPDRWRDALADANVVLVTAPWTTGRVHLGFKDALDKVWTKLTAVVDPLAAGRQVWFCGHSLGAALATLASARYSSARGFCTFGSPRVGDPTFAAAVTARFSGKGLRLVNNHDVVTHVPTPPLYKHLDLRRFIGKDGAISDGEPKIPHFFADLIGSVGELAGLVKTVATGTSSFTPQFLLDHMPKAYAIWTWNDYDAKG